MSQQISQRLGFTGAQQGDILNHFLKGGDSSAFGVGQAITRTAQTEQDGDAAFDLEAKAEEAIRLAQDEFVTRQEVAA